MNNSGIAAKKASDALAIPSDNVLIIQDDKDMLFGKIRYVPATRESRSGGHNGVASVIEHLGTAKIARLKVGVANASLTPSVDTAKFVLLSFIPQEKKLLPLIIEQATKEIEAQLA